MIEVRGVKFSDFEKVKRPAYLSDSAFQRNYIAAFMNSRSAVAAVDDESVLGIADTFPYENGRYVWLLLPDGVHRNRRSVAKLVRRQLTMYRDTHLYAHAETGDERAFRFLKWLGFSVSKPGDVYVDGRYFTLWHREPF